MSHQQCSECYATVYIDRKGNADGVYVCGLCPSCTDNKQQEEDDDYWDDSQRMSMPIACGPDYSLPDLNSTF